ncbi:hypothetical protein BZA77DRAFT_371297 [Pyronema omphalodes]|nr:hypothetical protein BZA77DRAFT_371297 [Pyronema omphalodes]
MFTPLPILNPATLSTFTRYLQSSNPCFLPQGSLTVPALSSWFLPGSNNLDLSFFQKTLTEAQLSTFVPIESSTAASFEKSQLPLGLFLQYLSHGGGAGSGSASASPPGNLPHLYLAQFPLLDHFPPLKESLPTPDLINAGKGDLYTTNIWLGYSKGLVTPIHKDPNGNIFLQLKGRKVIRLWAPEVWKEEELGGRWLKEEGMVKRRETGWKEERRGFEVTVKEGEGLFIPMGWWHAVRGVGEGVCASVNWWFR